MTLVSNASMTLFPNNKRSSFRTRLPFLHDFRQGEWLVGLTEITYTKSWFNVTEGHYVTPAYVDSGEVVLGYGQPTPIQPGFYMTTESLVAHVNELTSKWAGASVSGTPQLEVKSNRKVVHKALANERGAGERHIGVTFDEELGLLLGINDNRPAFLDQGMTSLYVYCDIVEPQVVGDSLEPLLRTVGVNSEVPFGQNITETFESPYYLPLARKTFQELQIDLRNDVGASPPFQFGRVALTLHFIQQ